MKELIIREGIVYLQEQVSCRPSLSLKLCCEEQIHRFHGLDYDSLLRRWQMKGEMSLAWPSCESISLEIYYNQDASSAVVIGEGAINLASAAPYLQTEIKIPLLLDGTLIGALYCELSSSLCAADQRAKTFLYLHRIDLLMLQNLGQICLIKVLRNRDVLFEKPASLASKAKTLFPNLKVPLRMSDVLTVRVESEVQWVREVRFRADTVRRGKTTTFEVWLRNRMKNKVGDLKMQYFLENLYLDNERQIFARKGIYPLAQEKPLQEMSEQEKDKLRRSVIIKQIEEADRRILKINQSMRRMIKNIASREKGEGVGVGSKERENRRGDVPKTSLFYRCP